MEKKTYPLYYGGNLMPWAKGTVVKEAKGFVFVAGTEGYDPTVDFRKGGKFISEDPGVQWRVSLEKIKSRLEEMGSSLEYIVFMTLYVKGPFPDGVINSPNYRHDVMTDFFKEHCPSLYTNPPAADLVGISSFAAKETVVEISCVAVIPDK